MQKIKYGLVISDFDGTLVNEDGSISEINKSSIAQFRQNGGAFAISTGRMPQGIMDRAKELGLQGAVSCCQGSVIMDIQSGKPIYDDIIPNAVAVKICKKMESMGLHIHAYALDAFYSNQENEALKWYEFATRSKGIIIPNLSAFLEETGKGSYKFLAMVKVEDNARVFTELEKENFEGCCVTKSGDNLVEVINAKNSKGTAVKFLSKYYNVPIENTVGIGDQWNDIPMLETAGFGVAVKNADERLKNAANLVLPYTNEEGAVGKFIQEFAYEKE
ncbi:MAG: HAD family hydrolase [Clostridia bacterium]|nr:HAD family hydrolase [Clostridia bacterium]